MKVIHLNTYEGNGGAGRACLRLNEALNAAGIESSIMVYFKFKESHKTSSFTNSLLQRVRAVIHILADRYLSKAVTNRSRVPFSLQWNGNSLLDSAQLRDADIIHLHWINHGFLSPRFLSELKQLNKPIVWTFHDNNPFTGGCHVRYSCGGYLHECGNCHLLRFPGRRDISHSTWKAKQKAYAVLNFSVIAPSVWMARSAQQASLTRDKPVRVIPNALETAIFKPLDRVRVRKLMHIGADAIVILAGYMPSANDRHKGLKELRETMHHLAADNSIDRDKLLLIFYGSDGKNVELDIPFQYQFAGKINDDSLLVRLYNAADVFLFPSIEESMGYTALESLSCGTPVAGFRTSGVTDVVLHKKTGYLAELYDTKELAEGIKWILKNSEKNSLSEQARAHAITIFNMGTVAEQHIDFYEEACNPDNEAFQGLSVAYGIYN